VEPARPTWIISGQSNAVGCAVGSGPEARPELMMWAGTAWITAHDPLAFMETNADCQVGPWVVAAQSYFDRTHQPVRLTGWGRANQFITLWTDGEGWDRLRASIPPPNGQPSVFLWYQGESEGYAQNATGYADHLRDLIARVRSIAGPDTLAVIVGLADAPASALYNDYANIRTAQQAVVRSDPHALYVSAEGTERQPTRGITSPRTGTPSLGRRVAAVLP
jgi:hypothetical protein